MQHKGEVVQRCQEMLEQLKELEREVAAEVRGVCRDAEAQLESEKKQFRAGYEERLQKVSQSAHYYQHTLHVVY